MNTPTARVANLVVDCNDLDAIPQFWSRLLALAETARDDRWVDLEPLRGHGPVLSFQRVPDAKAVKNRLHLDLQVHDIAEAVRRAGLLGASPAGPLHDGPGKPWQAWRDPEGNEFCLVTA
ncbi:MAG: VOC family protein [Carbonactinosporaceae bacterium]